MAQAASRQAMSIAPRLLKPAGFGGSDPAWRVLCDLYPTAESVEIVMAVVEYCAAKRLDPYKRPVHIVPMYNSKLRRKVQTIMRGINEIETIAYRTGTYAGLEMPQWGPDVTRTFRGSIENDDGSVRKTEATLTFPSWCAVTVYRIVGGNRHGFTEQLWWEEAYATAGFKSEVPNDRWQRAPRQMLHKCVKAAVLRAAFPEEGLGYAAEEMEDQFTTAGGVTIDGTVDHGDPAMTDRDRRTEQAPANPPAATPATGLLRLEEPNGSIWLRNFHDLLAATVDEAQLHEITSHRSVRHALEKAPSLIREQITDALRSAHERITPDAPEGTSTVDQEDQPEWDDPTDALRAEVETMDQATLDDLPNSDAWKARVRALFPPDRERIDEAITLRRATLKEASHEQAT